MRLFFWDYDDYNDIIREWIMFTTNIIVVIFTLYAFSATIKYYKRFIFELVPLSVNVIATIMLLLLKLFQKGYQFDQIAYLVEIFTYFLFSYTFALMYTKIKPTQRSGFIKKVFNGLLVLFVLTFIVLTVLVLAKVISKSCDRDVFEPALLTFIAQLISYGPMLYFGGSILKKLRETQKDSIGDESQSFIYKILSSTDEYIRQRKKQVAIVMGTYTSSLILRAILIFFTDFFDSYFDCDQIEGVYIITSDYVLGQITLIIIQINQLIPHVMIPIALFVIPIQRKRRRKSVTIAQDVYIQQGEIENQDDDGQAIRHRISSVLSSKNSVVK